jgi:O-antigen/teichoic acid export membrane protein
VFVEAMPYAFITVLHLVYSQGIVAIVERSVGPEAAAMYNVAYLIIAAVYLLPGVVYTKYLVGKIFRWWAQDRQMFSAVFHVGIAAHFVIGVIAMAIVIASASLFIPLLFGERYTPAVPILILLSVGIPIRYVQHSYGSAFFSKENVPCKIRYMGVAAAASLILNMALIPWLGVYGGAISAVSAEFVLLALYVQGAARHVDGIDIRSTFRVATIRSSLAYIGNSGGRQ